jgi:hypothetical protein
MTSNRRRFTDASLHGRCDYAWIFRNTASAKTRHQSGPIGLHYRCAFELPETASTVAGESRFHQGNQAGRDFCSRFRFKASGVVNLIHTTPKTNRGFRHHLDFVAEEIFRSCHRRDRRYDPGRGVTAGPGGRESLRCRRNMVRIETHGPA